MKKLIAILMVLAIVAGFAFAVAGNDETHTINIQANVNETLPAFKLRFASGSATTGQVTNNSTPTAYNPAAAADPAYSYADPIVVSWTLDEGGAVEVEAIFSNRAKTNKSFTLTFSDGVFTNVYKAGATQESYNVIPTISVAGNNTLPKGVKTIAASGNPLTVAFSGQKAAEGDKVLATATYTYGEDDAIDPGTYNANIVLTVASV